MADDYPWSTDTTNGPDWWGFTKRQCVSYCAWRLYKAGHPIKNTNNAWGSALHWDDEAKLLGKKVTGAPKVGAVAHWNAYESGPFYANGQTGTFRAGSYGHVAWVAAVYADESVLVRQYNMGNSRAYSTMHVKAPRYIYF